jgi:hypothetical protein
MLLRLERLKRQKQFIFLNHASTVKKLLVSRPVQQEHLLNVLRMG